MKSRWIDLGLTEYINADNVQREILKLRQNANIIDTILIAEFFPVFTIGRLGDIKNLLADPEGLSDNGVGIHKTDRGGDITYHGPGQLVVYPIINLADYKKDVRLYIKNLEAIIIDFLKKYNIRGCLIDGRTGVWVYPVRNKMPNMDTAGISNGANGKKIAQIGIAISKWVTYHGISLNVNVDKKFFYMINPCGLKDAQTINISELVDFNIDMADVKEKLLESFGTILNLDFEYDSTRIPAMA